MSILIKGMEMPKACYDCPCEYDGWCHATEILDEDGEWIHPTINDPYTKRQEWCPLVEQTMDESYYLNIISKLNDAIVIAQEALSIVRRI